MANAGVSAAHIDGESWLHTVNDSAQIDPRQKFTIKSLKSRENLEALEESVAELDQALADIRKIRTFCASLPRASEPR